MEAEHKAGAAITGSGTEDMKNKTMGIKHNKSIVLMLSTDESESELLTLLLGTSQLGYFLSNPERIEQLQETR